MAWLAPTLYYVVAVGALGITGKLALRTLVWQDLVLWTGLGYILVAGFLLLSGQTELKFTAGSGWALASAGIAISSLIALYLALTVGKASTVVPITAAYPAVTLLLAAAVLSEQLTLVRVAGVLLVIAGVVILTASG